MATITAELTAKDVRAILKEQFPGENAASARATINRWIKRGDGVAVYTNHDLGHRLLGHKQIVSFGSPDAQLEVPLEELPQRLPDTTANINWRYILTGVYTGSEPL